MRFVVYCIADCYVICGNGYTTLTFWYLGEEYKLGSFVLSFLNSLSCIPCGLPGNLRGRTTTILLSKLGFHFACGKGVSALIFASLISISCKLGASHRFVFLLRATVQQYACLLYLHSRCTVRFPLRHICVCVCVCVCGEREREEEDVSSYWMTLKKGEETGY